MIALGNYFHLNSSFESQHVREPWPTPTIPGVGLVLLSEVSHAGKGDIGLS